MLKRNRVLAALAVFTFAALQTHAQEIPATAGETLSGKPIVLSRIISARATQGHATALIAGFSKAAGDECGAWARSLRADPSMAGVDVYQIANLEPAPGFVRGMIQSAMRKGLSTAEQEHFIILKQDEKLWETYFRVSGDKDPYVILLSPSGQILWHGHGQAKDLEPLLRSAKP